MIDPEKVAAHLDALAKPKGSLGRLEELAVRLGSIQGTLRPETKPRRLIVFAGDHGVVADGVGIWPRAAIRGTLAGAPVAEWPGLVPKLGEIGTIKVLSA